MKNIKYLVSFYEYCNREENKNIDNIILELDEEKSTIHNLLNFVSNKRFEDNEKLGDLLSTYCHEPSLVNAKNIVEKTIRRVPKYVSGTENTPVWHEDKTVYLLNDYPVYLTNLIIKQLKKKQHSKYTDELVGKDRYFTLYN